MAEPRVEFRGVRKSFRMRNRSDALRDAIPRLTARLFGTSAPPRAEFVALDDVSFKVMPGEVLGIVGANGAGKSTSLRLAAGIYRPDAGEVSVRGRVSSLIELSAGFHPDLSGRENIFLVGALLGLRAREMEGLVEPIAEFADIGDFLESPVRTYSTGMAVRLGFAVAAFVPAEVLLVDEVLAVGDIDFQSKCLRRMGEVREQGTALLFVSHNLQIIEQFCDRVLFLHHGKAIEDGAPRKSLETFRRMLADEKSLTLVRESHTPRIRRGTGEILLDDVLLDGGGGRPPGEVPTGGRLRVSARWRAKKPILNPTFAVSIHSTFDLLCHESVLGGEDAPLGELPTSGRFTLDFADLALLPGIYEVTVRVSDSRGLAHYDLHQRLYLLRVAGPGPTDESGLIRLGATWNIERSGE